MGCRFYAYCLLGQARMLLSSLRAYTCYNTRWGAYPTEQRRPVLVGELLGRQTAGPVEKLELVLLPVPTARDRRRAPRTRR
jgi:hypothetical protein